MPYPGSSHCAALPAMRRATSSTNAQAWEVSVEAIDNSARADTAGTPTLTSSISMHHRAPCSRTAQRNSLPRWARSSACLTSLATAERSWLRSACKTATSGTSTTFSRTPHSSLACQASATASNSKSSKSSSSAHDDSERARASVTKSSIRLSARRAQSSSRCVSSFGGIESGQARCISISASVDECPSRTSCARKRSASRSCSSSAVVSVRVAHRCMPRKAQEAFCRDRAMRRIALSVVREVLTSASSFRCSRFGRSSASAAANAGSNCAVVSTLRAFHP